MIKPEICNRKKLSMRNVGQKENLLKELQRCFWEKIKDGPTYVCDYCEQLWYKESVRRVKVVSPGKR